MNDRYVTEHFAFIGRTLSEYRDMFGLSDKELGGGKVLDCPAGAASFVAEASALGIDATACDIIYNKEADELARYASRDIANAAVQLTKMRHLFTWGYYQSIDELIALRNAAKGLFLDDYRSNKGRYVEASLPCLPFKDNKFSIALMGHFLFLYGDRLDLEFHIASLGELLRVSHEVRVFPLTGLDSRPSRHLGGIIKWCEKSDITAQVIGVPLVFQRGGGNMLRIKRCKFSLRSDLQRSPGPTGPFL